MKVANDRCDGNIEQLDSKPLMVEQHGSFQNYKCLNFNYGSWSL